MSQINLSSVWVQLHQHQRATRHLHMRDLFATEPDRFQRFSLRLDGLLLDYSKNRITERTRDLLIELAHTAELATWMQRLQAGDAINVSEQRAVMHHALRAPADSDIRVDGENIVPSIQAVLQRVGEFVEKIHQQHWRGHNGKPIRHVVNIGIGGSDLGPMLVTRALKPYSVGKVELHFVSNLDGRHLADTLEALDAAETLFIVASKSFSTPETLLNAQAAREWFLAQGGSVEAIQQHFVAVSSNIPAATAFGIAPENCFPFWDWVGGRYSVWSAIGLPVMLSIGMNHFRQFLAGAHAMDCHFFSAPFAENAPVLLGLLGIWYNTFYRAHTHAVMPYDQGLSRLPAYLQQLDMESNGKRVGRCGARLDFNTGPIIWGEVGVNSQHAFFQLLHQGTRLVPCDFIIPACEHGKLKTHHTAMLANFLAQTEALMRGKNEAEVLAEFGTELPDNIDILLPQKVFPGNQPSNTLILDSLNPYYLGMLLALYEHKVFVQGVIWGINSFDQWGVEYGKQLARKIEPELRAVALPNLQHDASTNGLIRHIHQLRQQRKSLL